MAEIEYSGIKIGGSKLLLIVPLLGTIIGGLWVDLNFTVDTLIWKKRYKPMSHQT